jgi:hypothetical protein
MKRLAPNRNQHTIVELLEFANINVNAPLSGQATWQLDVSQDEAAEPFRKRAHDAERAGPNDETALDAGPLDFEGQWRDGIESCGDHVLIQAPSGQYCRTPNRFGDLRRSTLSWCRRTRISASNAAGDLNSPIKARQINPSLIRSEYRPIRSPSQRVWVCGRDSPEAFLLIRFCHSVMVADGRYSVARSNFAVGREALLKLS